MEVMAGMKAKYLDHIQGTNCSEWQCPKCDWYITGPTVPESCPNCNVRYDIKRPRLSLSNRAICYPCALGKHLARKFWDGLHDHPKASHVRDMTFDEYFNLNKDEYIGEATALIKTIRQG